jgi:hypothetical protein
MVGAAVLERKDGLADAAFFVIMETSVRRWLPATVASTFSSFLS